MSLMRALDLFTGYGGITLALEGYVRPIGYCEIEEYAQKIISYRMADGSLPRAPIFADIKNLRGSIGVCDIIYGGFPCQDISSAGRGAGLAGERSGLFYEIIRLAKEINPSFVFLENVPAIRTRGLREVIGAFTEIGYDCRWTCISAESIGAPHKRERWFLLAHTNSDRFSARISFQAGNKDKGFQSRRVGQKQSVANNFHNSPGERLERWLEPEAAWQTLAKCSSAGQYFGIQGLPEPAILRDADGFKNRSHRLKAIGNGVVPLQVRTAFEKLLGIIHGAEGEGA